MANSTVSRPLRRPRAILTRVSSRSDSRAARSSSDGHPGAGPRLAGGRRVGPRRAPRSPRPSAPTGPRPRSAGPAAPSRPSRPGPSRARAWPADSTPAATRRCTSGGRRSSRRVLEICGRERPIRAASSSWVQPKSSQQLLVRRGLLQRVELAAVQVLQQGVPQQVVLGRLADDGRHGGQPGLLAGPPAALAHDQLVASPRRRPRRRRDRPDDDRLEHADLPDRVDQLGHLVLVEDLPRLLGVGPDLADRDLGEVGARHRHQAVGRSRRVPAARPAASGSPRRRRRSGLVPVAEEHVDRPLPGPGRAARPAPVGISDPSPRPRPRRFSLTAAPPARRAARAWRRPRSASSVAASR